MSTNSKLDFISSSSAPISPAGVRSITSYCAHPTFAKHCTPQYDALHTGTMLCKALHPIMQGFAPNSQCPHTHTKYNVLHPLIQSPHVQMCSILPKCIALRHIFFAMLKQDKICTSVDCITQICNL